MNVNINRLLLFHLQLAAEDDIILETFGVNKEAKQETIDYLAHIEAEDPREKYQKELEKKKSKWIGLF